MHPDREEVQQVTQLPTDPRSLLRRQGTQRLVAGCLFMLVVKSEEAEQVRGRQGGIEVAERAVRVFPR